MQNIFLLHKSQMLTVPIDTTSKRRKSGQPVILLLFLFFPPLSGATLTKSSCRCNLQQLHLSTKKIWAVSGYTERRALATGKQLQSTNITLSVDHPYAYNTACAITTPF